MLKKMVIAAVLGLALSAAVFAQHPRGTGIGVVAQAGGEWQNRAWTGRDAGFNNLALSLKLPSVPVFWGINFDLFHDYYFGIGVTGDKYLYDKVLVPEIGLGWYLGIGGYGSLRIWDYYSADGLDLEAGVRVPIGLYLVLARQFEFFLDLAPSLGIGIGVGDVYSNRKKLWPAGGWASDFGFRFWF
jgi:hypothetical protein